MGTINKRIFSKIHNKKENITTNTSTYLTFSEYNYTSNKIVADSHYEANGCCTHSMNSKFYQGNRYPKYEWMFVRYSLTTLPSKYRSLSYLKQWVDFINETFPFSEIYLLHHDKETLLIPEFWQEKNISFSFNKKHVYFAIKKDTSVGYSYKNLFLLSLIRYIGSPVYFFMVYDTLRLRKLKSLSHLSNWDILNIARFGNQDNDYHNKSDSSTGMLYYYRSPFFINYLSPKARSFSEFIDSISRNQNQNNSFSTNSMKLNIIYLMHLFEKKRYLKLFSLINDPKYVSSYDPNSHWVGERGEMKTFVESQFGKNCSAFFTDLNNRTLDLKAYEKTL